MRRISTGVEQLLTSDEIADAVLDYAGALARASSADTITVPIVVDDGDIDDARLLLGPASQITIVPDGGTEVDLPGAREVVDELRLRIARLEPRSIPDDVDPHAGNRGTYFPDFYGLE